MRPFDPQVQYAGIIDVDDNLEYVIDVANGDTEHTYLVRSKGKNVGLLRMKDLVRSLVPSDHKNHH